MSKQEKIVQLQTQFNQFKTLDFPTFFENPGTYTNYAGLNIDEFQSTLNNIFSIFEEAFENEVFRDLSFASINALSNTLNNVINHCRTLINQRNQANFQNSAGQIDNLLHQLQAYNIKYYISQGADLDTARNVYETEAAKLATLTTETETLKTSVQSLIEPAVAGSLSNSFSKRKSSLYKGRIFWGIGAIIFAILAIYATYEVSDKIINIIQTNKEISTMVADVNMTQYKNNLNKEESSLSLILLRALILIPIYLGFGYTFSQYRKERDLEEEYAHKEAVATTLPSYGDLAKDDTVRDQIVSEASNVIFTSPIYRESKKESSSETIKSIKDLFETTGKIFKRND